jgi:rRNA maturation RNase YbeY
MALKSKVYFFFDGIQVNLRNRNKIKNMIEQIFLHEKKPLGRLNYVFCSDDTLLDINRRYLKHDFYTDIITFDLSSDGDWVNGEIYVSIDRITENARKFGESFQNEILRVIFHGALHLCGFKDKKKDDKEKMRKKEKYYLKKYSVIR